MKRTPRDKIGNVKLNKYNNIENTCKDYWHLPTRQLFVVVFFIANQINRAKKQHFSESCLYNYLPFIHLKFAEFIFITSEILHFMDLKFNFIIFFSDWKFDTKWQTEEALSSTYILSAKKFSRLIRLIKKVTKCHRT